MVGTSRRWTTPLRFGWSRDDLKPMFEGQAQLPNLEPVPDFGYNNDIAKTPEFTEGAGLKTSR